MGYSIRTKRYRYTEWQQRGSGKIVARVLFDYKKDPYETKNRVDDPEYQKSVKQLKSLLDKG